MVQADLPQLAATGRHFIIGLPRQSAAGHLTQTLGPMEEVTSRFDEASIETLTVLANSEIELLYAPSCSLTAGESMIFVRSLTIQMNEHRAIHLGIETHEFGTDNYFSAVSARISNPFNASASDTYPVGIRLWDKARSTPCWQQRVDQVSILSCRLKDEDEVAAFDVGIEVLTRDGGRLAIAWPGPPGAGFWVAHSAADVSRATSGFEAQRVIARIDSVAKLLAERSGLVTLVKLSDGRALKIHNVKTSWTPGVASDRITINIAPAPSCPHEVASFDSASVDTAVALESGVEIYRRSC